MTKTEQKGGVTVLLDTNFLFVPLRFGVDIFEELRRLIGGKVRCVVPSPVIEELHLLGRSAKPSQKKEADFALTLAEQCETVEERIESGETVDDALVQLATRLRCPVATNDADLRRRLRGEGVPVIYLRQRAYLAVEGAV